MSQSAEVQFPLSMERVWRLLGLRADAPDARRLADDIATLRFLTCGPEPVQEPEPEQIVTTKPACVGLGVTMGEGRYRHLAG